MGAMLDLAPYLWPDAAQGRQPQQPTPLDRASQLACDLTHLWALNAAGSRAWLDSAGAAHGVFGSGTTAGTSGNAWTLTPAGWAVAFSNGGTGTPLSVGLAVGDALGSGSPGAQTFTIAARIRLATLSSTQTIYGGPAGCIALRVTTSGVLQLMATQTASVATSTGTIQAGVDVDVAVAWDGARATFYLNGAPAGGTTASRTFTLSAQYAIGMAGVASAVEPIANGAIVYRVATWRRALAEAEVAAFAREPWQLFAPQSLPVPVGAEGAAPIATPTGAATEFDAALAPQALQCRAAGLAVEASSALPLNALQSRTVGAAGETDAALTLLPGAASAPGLCVEVDAPLALGRLQVRATGLASEIDTAAALPGAQFRAVAPAAEADAALALSPQVTGATAVGAATEADAALPLAAAQRLAVGIATEYGAAVAPRAAVARPAGVAAENGSALQLGVLAAVRLGLALEINAARALSHAGASVQLSTLWRYDVPPASLRYDVPGASLRFDIPGASAALSI